MASELKTQTENHVYNVKLESFEGPLDLLLTLIEDQKLSITNVSLARVTEQYLEYMRQLQELHMTNVIDFLVIASELLLIKSEMLLPSAEPRHEQEEESNLVERLQEYKKIKHGAELLRDLMKHAQGYFERCIDGATDVYRTSQQSLITPDITEDRLRTLMANLLKRIKPAPKLEEKILEPRVSLQDKISFIEKNLQRLRTFRFSHIAARDEFKIDIIVSFLAILELAKQQSVQVNQAQAYADIELSYI